MNHTCHAMGCVRPVPPRLFMCKHHWLMIPHPLRDAVWAEYVPGQEVLKVASRAHITIARRCIRLVAAMEGRIPAGEDE